MKNQKTHMRRAILVCLIIGISGGGGRLLPLFSTVNAAEPSASASATDPASKRAEANAQMFKALIEKDKGAFNRAIGAGADVNCHDEKGMTPLCYALWCWYPDSAILSSLLRIKADVNLAITKSVEFCRDPATRTLCVTFPAGFTPLMFAVARSEKRTIDLLIQNGADPDAKNSLGQTAEDYARGNVMLAPMVEALREAKAKYRSAGGGQPVASSPALATSQPQASSGTNREIQPSSAFPAAQAAAGSNELFAAISNSTIKAVRACLDKGVSANARDTYGEAAIIAAVREHDIEIVRLLIDKGADVNAANEDGTTALMFAARQYYPQILNVLLEKGAAVNASTKSKATALANAAFIGCLESVKILIAHGADIQWDDNRAVRTAAHRGHDAVVEELLKAGAKLE
jgi:ankyrin repeat protein